VIARTSWSSSDANADFDIGAQQVMQARAEEVFGVSAGQTMWNGAEIFGMQVARSLSGIRSTVDGFQIAKSSPWSSDVA